MGWPAMHGEVVDTVAKPRDDIDVGDVGCDDQGGGRVWQAPAEPGTGERPSEQRVSQVIHALLV